MIWDCFYGAAAGNRTQNLGLKRPLLCQLSYRCKRVSQASLLVWTNERRSGTTKGSTDASLRFTQSWRRHDQREYRCKPAFYAIMASARPKGVPMQACVLRNHGSGTTKGSTDANAFSHGLCVGQPKVVPMRALFAVFFRVSRMGGSIEKSKILVN